MKINIEPEKIIAEYGDLKTISEVIQKSYLPKDIAWLNKTRLILEEAAEKLKMDYLEGKVWKLKDARLKHLKYLSLIQQIKAKVKQLEYFERRQMDKKEQIIKGVTSSAAAKTLVDVITIMNRRQNAAAISQEHRNIAHPEAERKQNQAIAVDAPNPEPTASDKDLIALIAAEQQENPNLTSADAMILAQDKIAKTGIKTEDFDTSALIKRDGSEATSKKDE